jgi:O-antigen ligase
VSAAGSYSSFSGFRLGYPLTYWNAFGAMGAMGVILGAGLAGDPRSPLILRSLAAAATVPVGVAAYLSFSRGAWLAFFCGLAVLLVMSAHRTSLLASLAICGAALVTAIGRVTVYPALTDNPAAEAGQLAEGKAFFGFLLVLMVAAGGAQALVSGAWLPESVRDAGRMVARPLGIFCLATLVLAGGVIYGMRAGDVEGGTAERMQRAEHWIDRQWDEFMAPSAFSASGSERLTTAQGTRSDLYRVAIDGFQARPLAGDGGGGFEYRFAHERDVPERVRDAHSLYLETLGELGLPGLLLLLTFIGAAGYAAVAARTRRSALSGAQSAAAAGAFAVWVVHAGVDWDWQVPALTGAALLLAAAVFPPGRGRRRRSSRVRADPVADLRSRGRRRP